MSTTIDQKVVEMRFDNSHFEKNVSGTMSTLDKLKQKLNLSGASKGLENINTAANKVNMNGLSKGVETVTAKFSALQVVGTTALVNITNSAVNAGKRMISALTIDPVKTGFSEYETQINAVQTILANTSHNGTTIDQVNEALDLLNVYADKTIYNFTEMTRNIGTFTAAGVDLQTSVDSIQGIANLAAVSGSTSQQASTAMYQLSQALAAGKVSLMDWNSVVNAGMGGKVFQDALVRTSELLGTGAKGAIDMYGSFRESLTKGEWLTTEVLTETLKQFAGAYSEADLIAQGFTEQQAKDIAAMAKTAEEAATKVKTFTQLWDVLKESAQSGWSQTWKIIIGDYEEAKELLSPLADILTGFINKMSDARNRIVEGVLDFASPWTSIMDKLGKVKEVAKSVEQVTDKLEYFQNVVNNVWRGDFKNADTGRYELLEKAGYDHRVVQDLVNKGYQYKLTVEDIEASHKKFGLTMKTTTEKTKEVTSAFNNLTEEQLKEAGLTEEEIKLYQDLQREAERTGKSISELADEMSKTSGRTLLIESFKNIGNGLLNVFRALGEAWKEIFDPVSIVGIYNALKAFNNFTLSIKNYLGVYDEASGEFVKLSENGENLKRTFKGIFAVLDIITTLIGGGFKIAFKLVTSVLKYFNLDILDVTAAIGDALVKFRDWFDSLFDVSGALDVIVPLLVKAGGAIKTWITQFKNSEQVQKFVERISSAFKDLKTSINQIGGIKGILSGLFKWLTRPFKNIDLRGTGKNIFDGLIIGLVNGAGKVITTIIDVAKNIIDYFKDILGIHSPSKVFIAIGGFIIAGLLLGLKEGFISVPESLQGIVDKCLEVLKNIDWGAVFAVGVSVAGLYFLKKIGDALGTLAAPLEGLGEVFDATAGVLKSLSFEIKTKAIKNLAISLAILVGCVLAIVALCGTNYWQMWNAVLIIGALAAILVGLAWATNKLSDASVSYEKGKLNVDGLKQNLLTIAAAIGILGLTVKMLGSMNVDQYTQGMLGMVAAAGVMVLLLVACRKLVSNKSAKNLDVLGSLMLKLSIAMLLMAAVCKIIGKLSLAELGKGGLFVAGFAAFLLALAGISRLAGKNITRFGGTMVKLAIAMGLMVLVLKLVDLLSIQEALKGIAFAGAFALFVKALVKVTTVGKDTEIAKIGGLLLGISFSMMLMVGVCKLVGLLSPEDMIKGAAFMLAFTLFTGILVKVTTVASGKEIAKVGTTILAISIAIGILALVSMVLSLMSIEGLIKGVVAVSILSAMMALMINSLKDANDVKGSLIVMAVAIGVMAAAVAALSLIKPERLAVATAAMSALMGMFALMVKASKDVGKSIGTLITMMAAIVVMAGVLWLLSTLDVKSSIQNAAALSMLMLTMAGCLFIVSKLSGNAIGALKGIGLLTAMVVPMMAFVAVLHFMPDITKAKEKVLLLAQVMVAMTALLAILTLLGNFGVSAIIGVGLLTAMVVPMMAFVAVLHFMPDIAKSKDNVLLLTQVMIVMTALLAVLSLVGFLAPGGLAGIIALTLMIAPMLAFIYVMEKLTGVDLAVDNIMLLMNMMTIMTGLLTQLAIVGPLAMIGVGALQGLVIIITEVAILATAIGALADKWESFETFLNIGLPILEKIAGGIGRMLGAFVGGFIGSVATCLPILAIQLSAFMVGIQPFINGAKAINKDVLVGIGVLTAAILLLTAADLINGIASFLHGGLSFARLGTELSLFMINALPFISAASLLNETMMNGVKALAETILILTAANVLDGLTSWFTGGNSLGTFAQQLPILGAGIAGFINAVGTIDESKVETAANAAKIIKELASAASEIPNTGGLLASIVGDNDMEAWAESLPDVGEGIADFIEAVGEIGDDQVGTASTAAEIIKILASAAQEIPNTGGLLASIVGDNDLSTFAENLPDVGEGIAGFIEQVGEIDSGTTETAKCAADIISTLATVSQEIPNTGGLLASIVGDNDLSTFADSLSDLGEGISEFMEEVEDFNEDDVESIKAAVSSIKAITSLADADLENISDNIDDFGDKLEDFGSAVSDFCEELTAVDSSSMTTAINNVNEISSMARNLNDLDSSGAIEFKKAVETIGKTAFDKFTEALSGATASVDVTDAAKSMIENAITGVKSKKESFNKALKSLVSDGIGVIKTQTNYDKFLAAGAYLVDGFAAGIRENTYKAEAKAAAMANAAEAAAKAALAINSPSKVFRKIGYSVPEGFAMGIDRMSGLVQNSVTGMADGAIKNVSRSISRIGDAVNADIDSQPTIRPVLDLSDVRSGASAISGLFNEKTLVGVRANVSSINRSMNDNLQNGGNSDIISAINKLRKDLGNVGNTTYQINGITYDDGSALQDAFGTIVRQARIERRV